MAVASVKKKSVIPLLLDVLLSLNQFGDRPRSYFLYQYPPEDFRCENKGFLSIDIKIVVNLNSIAFTPPVSQEA
jgi:hypothetical protein